MISRRTFLTAAAAVLGLPPLARKPHPARRGFGSGPFGANPFGS